MTAALRPLLPDDIPLLAGIFRASIEEMTGEDYSPAQQEAWAASADDEAAFGQRLSTCLTLVATMEGSPVGFAALKGADHIEMVYVHPAVTGLGVAALLVDALEKLARARGAGRLTVDASDTALGFFEKRGYIAQRRNTVPRGGEWLANTSMERKLAANGSHP